MNSRPARSATWLLKRLGCSPNTDAVIGDLMERQSQGKSFLWYWRQVVAAIFASLVSQAKDNPRPILRGIAAGWIVHAVWLFFFFPVLFSQSSYPRWVVIDFYFGMLLMIGLWFVSLCVQSATGWVVSRTSAEYRKPALFGYFVTTLMYGAAEFGWQRFQFWRTHPGASWSLVVTEIVSMGSVVSLFAITALVATLFGGGLLTGSHRISSPRE